MPAFHAILLLRDEADIIAQTLEHLLTWCDTLIAFDTGSFDESWDIVTDFAARDRRIITVGKEPVIFTNGLRGWLFDQHKHRFRTGDWIARVDCDDFYHILPPHFVRDQLRRGESLVVAQMHDFLLTRAELKAWQDGHETLADRARPIELRRRYFRHDDHPEFRLFRYRRSMRWSVDEYNPFSAGLPAEQRIPIRHYRARDPVQLQRRCALRAATARLTHPKGHHWRFADWRRFIADPDDPRWGVLHWPEGQPLPLRSAPNHLAPPRRRAFQHLLYRTPLITIRDQLRPRNPVSFRPTPLPGDIAATMQRYIDAIVERPYLRDTPLQAREHESRTTVGPDVGGPMLRGG